MIHLSKITVAKFYKITRFIEDITKKTSLVCCYGPQFIMLSMLCGYRIFITNFIDFKNPSKFMI